MIAASNGHLETVRELLNNGASVDIKDKDGRNPMVIAASQDHADVLLELQNHLAKVIITDF